MASRIGDVSPTVASMLIEYWRTTPVWQKLAAINDLNATLQTLALSDLRHRYPTESDAQVQRRLAARWLGPELADQVYGPIPGDSDAAH